MKTQRHHGRLEAAPAPPPGRSGRGLGILYVTGVTVGALVLSVGALIGQAARPANRPDLAAARPPISEATPSIAAETLVFPRELLAPSRASANLGPDASGDLLSAPQLPAGVGAVPSRAERLRRAGEDPMIAAALPPLDRSQAVPPGEDGKYTLHVISYETSRQAREFASNLQARGHRAFITTAELPERGPTWRVRIGPFASRREAEKYRRGFEMREHMNTFVVVQKRQQ